MIAYLLRFHLKPETPFATFRSETKSVFVQARYWRENLGAAEEIVTGKYTAR